MGFKTIDLDAPGGYERYNKMKKTNSVKAAFEDEIEQKNEEALSPVVEEVKKKAEEESEVKKDDNEKIQNVPEKGPEVKAEKTPKVEEKSTTTQDNIVRTGVVKGVSQLRVRNKPEGDILFLISENSVVKILEDHDGWWFVETAPGRQGYVMKAYIQVRTEGG